MKRFIALGMTAVMLMSSSVFAQGVEFAGNRLDCNTVIVDGRTYVPIRDVFEAMGFTVEWDATAKTVTLENDYYKLVLLTTSNELYTVDSFRRVSARHLENHVRMIDGRTMLPLREILEGVGYVLDWNGAEGTAIVTDANDYAVLEENKARISRFEEIDEASPLVAKYKADGTRAIGTLTAEEKSFFDNYFAEIAELEKSLTAASNSFDGDIDAYMASLEKCFDEVSRKVAALNCPQSLEDIKTSAVKAILSAFESIKGGTYAQLMLDDEQDLIKQALQEKLYYYMSVSSFMPLAEVDEMVYNFFEGRNVDTDSVFGDKYVLWNE
jgi:hypothetical protein